MWTKEEAREVINEVMKRASYDGEFRKLVLNEPERAVKEVAGKEVPEDITVKFVESEGVDRVFVLPPLQDEELAEEDLEEVAGGCFIEGCKIDY